MEPENEKSLHKSEEERVTDNDDEKADEGKKIVYDLGNLPLEHMTF